MKVHYLKNKQKLYCLELFVMLTEKKVIDLHYTKIEINEIDNPDDFETEIDWYKEHWQMEDATKKEFDEFYMKIVADINNSVNEICELTTIKN